MTSKAIKSSLLKHITRINQLCFYGAKYTPALNIRSGIRIEMVKTTSVVYTNTTNNNQRALLFRGKHDWKILIKRGL